MQRCCNAVATPNTTHQILGRAVDPLVILLADIFHLTVIVNFENMNNTLVVVSSELIKLSKCFLS
jgi:hypothetical protein